MLRTSLRRSSDDLQRHCCRPYPNWLVPNRNRGRRVRHRKPRLADGS